MLLDALDLSHDAALECAVCVVGSGAAGTTIAVELARAGIDLVLLEGGGARPSDAAQEDLRGELESGTVHAELHLVRQKRVGGTTNQWGGRCAPLDADDFERRPWVAHSGWPISLEDLAPYYRRAHPYCELGAFEYRSADALADVLRPCGDGRRPPGDARPPIDVDHLWRWSPPVEFGRRYRKLLSRASCVRLISNATVVLLDHDGAGGISEARARTISGREIRVRARQFVLAGGGLETARLMLASNTTWPSGLGNGHDQLGRYYHTHPVGEVARIRFTEAGRSLGRGFEVTRDGVYCRRRIRLSAQEQERHGLLNLSAASWYPDPRDPSHRDGLLSAFALVRLILARARPDWRSKEIHGPYRETSGVGTHLVNLARDLPRVVGFGLTFSRRRWLSSRAIPSFMPRSEEMRLHFDAEQSPDPENRVTLSPAVDRLGLPRLRLRYRVSDSDRASIARSLAAIGQRLEDGGLAGVELGDLERTVEQLRFADGTHQMGLTRMASSPRTGVVDRDCRVHGTKNLYVASSSVFPTGGAVGPTLTIVALALRIADLVARRTAATPVAFGPESGTTGRR